MPWSTSVVRSAARLAALLPFALVAACAGHHATDDKQTVSAANEPGVEIVYAQDASTDGGVEMPPTPDLTFPTVVSTDPPDTVSTTPGSVVLHATFSEPMKPSTITRESFTLTRGGVPVPGAVSYIDDTATFLPASELVAATTYVATITTAAQDRAGNPLGAAYTWAFMVAP